jgi:hypothetical protein
VAFDGAIVGSVERKSLVDLVSTLTTGKLRYLLAELAALPHAAVVVEDRYSAVFRLDRVRPLTVVAGLAEAQVRFPNVPIVFCETRLPAQEWGHRFLGAALVHERQESGALDLAAALPEPGRVTEPEPTTADVRSGRSPPAWKSRRRAASVRRYGLRSVPPDGAERTDGVTIARTTPSPRTTRFPGARSGRPRIAGASAFHQVR